MTTNKGLATPVNGSYVNTWDVPVNANWNILDAALGGSTTLNVVGLSGVNALTTTQYQSLIFSLQGALTANINYQLPAGVGGQWVVYNGSTGAYTITFSSAGGGASYVIPQGTRTLIVSDGTNVLLSSNINNTPIGSLTAFAGSTPPSQWYLCYGQAVSRTVYATLFAVLGTAWGVGDGSTTFNLPDMRGRTVAGLDNMGGTNAARLSTAIPTSTTLGAVGGDQNLQVHAHGASTSVGISDPGHNHYVNDPGHNHYVNDPGHNHGNGDAILRNGPGPYSIGGSANVGFANLQASTTGIYLSASGTGINLNASGTGITASGSTTVNSVGSGSAQNVQPSAMVNWLIYAGV